MEGDLEEINFGFGDEFLSNELKGKIAQKV